MYFSVVLVFISCLRHCTSANVSNLSDSNIEMNHTEFLNETKFPDPQSLWITTEIFSVLSVIGCASIIISIIWRKIHENIAIGQHDRFVLMVALNDTLFSLSCLILCAITHASHAEFLSGWCINEHHISIYCIVWFFYFSGLLWVFALTIRSFLIIVLDTQLKGVWEIFLFVIIPVLAVCITILPNLANAYLTYTNVYVLCLWGNMEMQLSSVLVIVIPMLVLFLAIIIKLNTFQATHLDVSEKIKNANRKTLVFLFIVVVGQLHFIIGPIIPNPKPISF